MLQDLKRGKKEHFALSWYLPEPTKRHFWNKLSSLIGGRGGFRQGVIQILVLSWGASHFRKLNFKWIGGIIFTASRDLGWFVNILTTSGYSDLSSGPTAGKMNRTEGKTKRNHTHTLKEKKKERKKEKRGRTQKQTERPPSTLLTQYKQATKVRL